ncbi:uncharacterized protein [Prorops nasuta]|uniref:uncharacterized protein n=1 Tax=Prorops nasuta TaxID=863751 RepID=UPI0034CE1D7A
MSRVHFEKLLTMVKPYLKKRSLRALNPELRLLITLRYIATGDLYFTIAIAFRVGESTVRSIVKEVCDVLIKVLQPIYLSLPTKNEWRNNAKGYWARWNMPNCLGSIDGKHIRLRCPPNSGSLYFNYKKYYSIVLLAIADHLYRFVLVDIGAYGGNSDGGIFSDSNIGINLSNNKLNIPDGDINLPHSDLKTPMFFIADDAFQLSKRIMKPYSSKNLQYSQQIFNYRLSRARRTIESAFGILASKWRILHNVICVLPDTADIIVNASVCLHNFVLKEEQKCESKDFSKESNLYFNQNFLWLDAADAPNNEENNYALNGDRQRNTLKDYFISTAGQVQWQHEYVQRGAYRNNE